MNRILSSSKSNRQHLFDLSQEIGLTQVAPSIDLNKRVIVITGAADGIGAAYSHAAIMYGSHVIGIDVQDDKLKKLAAEFGPGRFTRVHRDLSKPLDDNFRGILEAIGQRHGKIDGYVMNAGVIKLEKRQQDLLTTPADELRKAIQINALSHLEIFQVLYPFLAKSDAGRIVSTSSPIVGRTDANTVAYATSKGLLQNLTGHMHTQVKGSSILVTGYVPPPVENWLRADLKDEPSGSQSFPVDIIEVPLRLSSASLRPEFNGKTLVFVDKRENAVTPTGKPYQYNLRTASGFDLGIRIRPLNVGGGTEGAPFMESYDTGNARRLAGAPPAPLLDPETSIRDIIATPAHIKRLRQHDAV